MRAWFFSIILAATPITPLGASQANSRSDEARVAACIHIAASGRPWLEKTLWGLRDQEAGWVGAEVLNVNGTHDLGPLQVNSWWVPRVAALLKRPAPHVRAWLRDDPCFNAEAARWIFLSVLATSGDYWKAVGMYHSPAAWRQRDYAFKVATHMERRYGKKMLGWVAR